jgi:hypothetical protein
MLGRKSYTPQELDDARTAMDRQLAAYDALVEALDGATSDPKVAAALAEFEPLFAENLTLALDRRFVHRLRAVTGKDGNPLNEVELMAESLMNNHGVLRGNNVIKLKREESVLKIGVGEPIRLGAAEFRRLSRAFLDQIEAKFVEAA